MDNTKAKKANRNLAKVLRLAFITSLLLTSITSAQQPPPDRRFGAVEASRYVDGASAATEAGVGWERILFYWSELQREGPGDWNGFHVDEGWLNRAAAGGREMVAVLKHTPAWATDGLPGCGVPRGLDLPIDDPNNLWAAFVRKSVEIYKDRIKHWVIWNEPDIAPGEYGAEWCGSIEEYYQLLKVAYLAAHQVDPDAVIHLAGLTYFHDTAYGRTYYLTRFLQVATQDSTGQEYGYYFDVVSLHIYFEIKNFDTLLRETHAALAAYGLNKPIWINETDAPPNSDDYYPLPEANFQISLEEQASFMLQAFSLALSGGAERIAVYKWVVADPPPPGAEPNGIVRPDGSRRPSFDAYKLITTHYAGTISASESRQPSYTVVTLDRGDLTTRVLWARTQSETTVSLPALASQAQLIDQTGVEQTITPTAGQYTIMLPGARCTDKRGCIIGGFTYLLVEDAQAGPPPDETASPSPTGPPVDLTDSPVITATTAPTPLPTDTPEPTSTPTALPTDTPEPTSTSTPLPTDAPTPTPTSTPTLAPSPAASPNPTATPAPPTTLSAPPLLVGMIAFVFLAVAVGVLFKRS